MGLLVDRAFVDEATAVPALREMIRDALIEALFTRDDRALPPEIVSVLARVPAVTLKPANDVEVQRIVNVANGQESTVSLGLPAEDYHFVRRGLAITKDRDIGVHLQPGVVTTHPWIVPPQGGVEIDTRDLSRVDVDPAGNRATVGVGARWKALHDTAASAGRQVPFVPLVPLDVTIGDALCGDAVLGSYRAPFRRYVYAVRSIASHGRRARLGFEEVPNHGTGYDVLNLLQNSLAEFVVPVEASVALEPRPRASKTLAYQYADPAKLAAAVQKLSASGRRVSHAAVYDASGGSAVRPGAVGGPFSLEVSLGNAPSVLAVREKALDAVLAGFTAKAEVPSPYNSDPRAYAAMGERVGRLLIPGYLTFPAKALPDVVAKLEQVADATGARLSLFGAARQTGTISVAPGFETPKEPPKTYRVSRHVWELTRGMPGVSYLSRLAALWADEPMYRARVTLLQKLKAEIDSARVTEPTVALR